jgi:Protein of unknown function (DUF2510)
MTTPNQPGWYDDPQDANAQRYWDGQDWTPHRQRKPVSPTARPSVTPPLAQQPPPPTLAQQPPPPTLAPPSGSAPTQAAPRPTLPPPLGSAPTQAAPRPTFPPPPGDYARGAGQGTAIPRQPPPPAWPPPSPQPEGAGAQMASDGLATVRGIVGNFSIAAWLLVGGFVITLIATFFPYATVSVNALGSIVFSQEVSANGASRFVVLLLVGVAAGLAWPALSGSEVAVWRLVGLSAVVGVLGVLMVVWFTNVSADNREGEGAVNVSPGFGLLLYGTGVIVIAGGVIRLWILRSQTQNRAS